ncbi:lysophospholipid acyltransferase family protein [Entomobacter blattae]|nr:lysophospholipid acyltransferase family protein [Entomobacter blattae]
MMGVLAFIIRWFIPHYALAYAKCWTALSIFGLKWICHIQIDVQGLEKLPQDRPFLIASQHQSAFDTLVWMNILSRPAYIMKHELTRIPLLGPMLLLAGMIPIDRKGGSAALRKLTATAIEKAAQGFQIIIFPQGTRTSYGEHLPIQPGIALLAKETKLPIFPVITNSGLHWPKKGILKFRGTIYIRVGLPLSPTLPRKELLTTLQETWEKMEKQPF